MTYVLLIITHVYYGAVVTMQEFSSKENCEAAKTYVITDTTDYHPKYDVKQIACIPK